MLHFWIALVFGLIIVGLLLLLYIRMDTRSKKVRLAEKDFIYNCGDSSLIALYDQAVTDKERADIAEFVKEKIALDPSVAEPEKPVAEEEMGNTLENVLAEGLDDAQKATKGTKDAANTDFWSYDVAKQPLNSLNVEKNPLEASDLSPNQAATEPAELDSTAEPQSGSKTALEQTDATLAATDAPSASDASAAINAYEASDFLAAEPLNEPTSQPNLLDSDMATAAISTDKPAGTLPPPLTAASLFDGSAAAGAAVSMAADTPLEANEPAISKSKLANDTEAAISEPDLAAPNLNGQPEQNFSSTTELPNPSPSPDLAASAIIADIDEPTEQFADVTLIATGQEIGKPSFNINNEEAADVGFMAAKEVSTAPSEPLISNAFNPNKQAETAAEAELLRAIGLAETAKAEINQELPGLSSMFAGSAMHGLIGEEQALANHDLGDLELDASLLKEDDLLPKQDATYDGKTRVLPLDQVDWATVQEEIKQKNEQDAAAMAQNVYIQEVFAKVKNIEENILNQEKAE